MGVGGRETGAYQSHRITYVHLFKTEASWVQDVQVQTDSE